MLDCGRHCSKWNWSLGLDASFGVVGTETGACLLAWPTPGKSNQAMPPQRHVIDTRLIVTEPGGAHRLDLRWLAGTASQSHVEYSDRLAGWIEATNPPRHLGEGLFEWTDPDPAAPRKFYRVYVP